MAQPLLETWSSKERYLQASMMMPMEGALRPALTAYILQT
jgi:hypothetical protein